MARELNILIRADGSQARAALREVEGGLRTVTQSTEDTQKATQALLSILTADHIRAFVSDLKHAGQEFVGAYNEQEKAAISLTAALRTQGQATPAIIKQYEELATKFEHTTVFSDELVQSMESLFVQVGNVGPQQMDAALKAATDLSAGLGIDLRTATLLVAKAFEGHTETLGRYGIVLDEAKLKADPVAAVLEGINQKFGGQAQAQLETYSGKMQVLSNQMNNVEESVGKLLVRGLTPLLTAFGKLPQPVQTVTLGFVAVSAALAPAALSFAALAPAISIVLPMLSTALPAAFAAIMPFLGPVGLIAAGVTAVLLIWKNWDWIVGFFQGAWTLVTGMLQKTPTWLLALLGPIGLVLAAFKHWDDITDIAMKVYTGVKTWLVDKFAAVVNMIGEKVHAVTGFFADLYDKVIGHSYVPDLMRGIEQNFSRLGAAMVNPSQAAASAVKSIFDDLAQHVSTSISTKLFGEGAKGLLGGLATGGISTAIGIGVGALTNFITGIGKPSQAELQGRSVAAQFRDELTGVLNEAQKLEVATAVAAGNNKKWAETVIGLRDAYLAAGHTEAEALSAADRLWKAEKQGGDAVQRVIAQITLDVGGKFKPEIVSAGEAGVLAFAGISDAAMAAGSASQAAAAASLSAWSQVERVYNKSGNVSSGGNPDRSGYLTPSEAAALGVAWRPHSDFDWSDSAYRNTADADAAELARHHTGGMVLPFVARAHRGLAVDEVPIIAQTAEGILSRRGMRNLGGPAALNALNHGGGGDYGALYACIRDAVREGASQASITVDADAIAAAVPRAVKRRIGHRGF